MFYTTFLSNLPCMVSIAFCIFETIVCVLKHEKKKGGPSLGDTRNCGWFNSAGPYLPSILTLYDYLTYANRDRETDTRQKKKQGEIVSIRCEYTRKRPSDLLPLPHLPLPLSLFVCLVCTITFIFSSYQYVVSSPFLCLFCVCHRLVFSWFLSDLKNFLMFFLISDLFVYW